jgi:hypothetical protein
MSRAIFAKLPAAMWAIVAPQRTGPICDRRQTSAGYLPQLRRMALFMLVS